jgi:hypothetical protein
VSSQAPGLSGHEVVFRPDRGFRRSLVRRGVLALVFAGLAAAAGTTLGTPMFTLAGLCGVVAAGCAAGYVWRGRFRTVLTPEGIRVRGYFNHFVPWSDVAGFAVRSRGSAPPGTENGPEGATEHIEVYRSWRGMSAGTGRTPSLLITVQVVRTKGHKLRLRAPVISGWQGDDDEFDDKVELMREWRRRYGPPPVTGPR